jgi:predicted acetyltransferase
MPTCNKNRLQEIFSLRTSLKRQARKIQRAQEDFAVMQLYCAPEDEQIEKVRLKIADMAHLINIARRRLQKRQHWGLVKIHALTVCHNGIVDERKTELCRTILYQRYYTNADWYKIAGEIGYSVRQTQRLHAMALRYL